MTDPPQSAISYHHLNMVMSRAVDYEQGDSLPAGAITTYALDIYRIGKPTTASNRFHQLKFCKPTRH
jgi:hypothetical protein